VLNIYPNPANEILNIESNTESKIGFIELFNIQGTIVKSVYIGVKKTSINISGLPDGLYIIRVQNENGVTQKKLIKN
jgi:hypothetical protein